EVEVKNSSSVVQKGQVRVSSREKAVEHLLGTLWNGEPRTVTSPAEIDVVGHRVVHGGPKYAEPVLLTPEVKAGIAKVSAFAPLHNRAELEGMEVIEKLLGAVPQVAVFDTGFHRRMPQAAAVYPGPHQWFESGILPRRDFYLISLRNPARVLDLSVRDLVMPLNLSFP